MSTLLERRLQEALDNGDCESIDKIMPKLFPDYTEGYAKTLIAYNEECDIKACDLIRFRLNFPNMIFSALFTHETSILKGLCDISEEDLAILDPPCG